METIAMSFLHVECFENQRYIEKVSAHTGTRSIAW